MPWLLLPPSDGLKSSCGGKPAEETDSEEDSEEEEEEAPSWLRYGTTTSDSDAWSSESDTEGEQQHPLKSVMSGKRSLCKKDSSGDLQVDDDWLQIPAGRPRRRAASGASACLDTPAPLVRAPPVETKQFPIARNRAQYYACQRNPLLEVAKTNANKDLTDILQKMEKLEKNSGEHWRAMAYRKAITALKRHPHPIRSAEDALKLRGIGERIAKKVCACSYASAGMAGCMAG